MLINVIERLESTSLSVLRIITYFNICTKESAMMIEVSGYK